jgi:DNA recombination protein RmuC
VDNDKQNRFALEIASEAGKMYDKFVAFVNDLDKMGNQLKTLQRTYDNSMNKLNMGSGNLVGKAEKIRALGAKANKRLPNLLGQAITD